MQYEGQICRAPMERSSFMLPVMVGCSYNRCKFCNLFRHLTYRVLPLEQVEAELLRVKSLGGAPKRIFLGDGNAFGLKMERLLDILALIRRYFPDCEAVNMDATVTSILQKSDQELKSLYEQGVRHLYLGIESGLDDVLKFMNKDHDQKQAALAIERLHQAGMIFDAHIMTGVAGHGRGAENALAMAEFLNAYRPTHVVNFSMFLHRETGLYPHIADGSFVPADELENLKEERILLENLGKTAEETDGAVDFSEEDGRNGSNSSSGILYDGFHDYIEFRVRGRLPEDRQRMLLKLDQEIARREGQAPQYAYVCGQCPDLVKVSSDEAGERLWK